jgi:hypothetical protein
MVLCVVFLYCVSVCEGVCHHDGDLCVGCDGDDDDAAFLMTQQSWQGHLDE